MSNLNSPASPQSGFADIDNNNFVSGDCGGEGFTKRERACIDLRIPESGDTELDALIEKARRQEVAAKAMQGILACHEECKYVDVAVVSTRFADALLTEMERTDG